MGIFDKVKDAFGISEDEYDEEDYLEEEEEEEVETISTFRPEIPRAAPAVKKERNVSLSSLPQLRVVLVKPENFSEASDIADSLNAKKTVVLNLEAANKETSRRLVDFLSGVAYANQGNVQKIANSTFLITPYNVDISGIGLIDDMDVGGNIY